TIMTLGGSEVEAGQVTVKNNITRQEVTVTFEEISEDFASILQRLEA
ncbi:histidine--tRNA ligase, partial [Streptococcus thoraltensis]